jgi:pimeloyl-ACP methyl ester carboxylesterase
MHKNIASGPRLLGSPLAGPVALFTKVVYGSVKGTTVLVGAALDVALATLAPLLGESTPGFEREAVLAALNGVLGDYLHETKNPLAMTMSLRMPSPLGRRLLVMVHGSSLNDLQWRQRAHDHGEALAADRGYSVAYLRYNSGLHVSSNGAAFAAELEAAAHDVDEIVIVCHSMGGLVTRAACLHADDAGHAWRKKLTAFVTLGTPHHGAPLERGGSWIDFLIGVNRYSAPLGQLGRIRSAGVTDLRYGSVRDEDWHGRDRFAHAVDARRPAPLPSGVRCYAIAGTLSRTVHKRAKSDGLVPVASALGLHKDPKMTLAYPADHQVILAETSHLDLLSSAAVYAQLRAWL